MKDTYGKNWITEGLEVAHIDNINQRMIVEKFVSKSKPGGMTILLGVKCYWFEEYSYKGELKKRHHIGTFHSRHLVPWEVSLMGKEGVKRFRKEVQGIE